MTVSRWAVPVPLELGAAALLCAGLACPVSAQEAFADPRPDAAALLPVARDLAAASPGIAELWPGFWAADQRFLLLSPHGGMLLVAAGPVPEPFAGTGERLGPLEVWRAEGFLPGHGAGSFPGTYELNGRPAYALPPMGRSRFDRTAFYVHEAFHFHQRGDGGWAEVPEDSIVGLSPEAYVTDPAVVSGPAFLEALAVEDSLLRALAVARDPDRIRGLLRAHHTARATRLREHPELVAVERRYERREGTAEYVGCRAAVLATGGSDAELAACLTDELGDGGGTLMQILRWRLYASGAVLSSALDRLGVRGWKEAVAAGTHLDALVMGVVIQSDSRP